MCDHRVGRFTTPASEKQRSNAGSGESQARDICPKCGAKRIDRQIGQEPDPDSYVQTMVEVFREVRRVLHDSGTVWLNVGDSYSSHAAGACADPMKTSKLAGVKTQEVARDNKVNSPYRTSTVIPEKNLCLIPWRLAIALQADGWWVRSVICWAKKSCMPESVTDRPTNSWEPIFLLAKSAKYFYDAEAVKEPAESEPHNPGNKTVTQPKEKGSRDPAYDPGRTWGNGMRNQRNVWSLGPEPYAEAHFATFPTEIPRRAILAGTSARGCCPKCYAPWTRIIEKDNPPNDGTTESQYAEGMAANRLAMKRQAARERGEEFTNKTRTVGWEPGCECGEQPIPQTVLDPFGGSGTTGQVALELARHAILCELSPEYAKLIETRTQNGMGLALH